MEVCLDSPYYVERSVTQKDTGALNFQNSTVWRVYDRRASGKYLCGCNEAADAFKIADALNMLAAVTDHHG